MVGTVKSVSKGIEKVNHDSGAEKKEREVKNGEVGRRTSLWVRNESGVVLTKKSATIRERDAGVEEQSESGRKKVNQITRWLTILICVVKAPAYIYGLSALGVPESAFVLGKGPLFIISSVIILVTGTIFAMWLGEKITDRGIGNGISLLITVGIVATLPLSFTQNLISRISESNGGLLMVVIELAVWLVIILLRILLVMAV